MAKLSVGDPFPDVAADSADGQVRLNQHWRGGPLVVAFMRHFG